MADVVKVQEVRLQGRTYGRGEEVPVTGRLRSEWRAKGYIGPAEKPETKRKTATKPPTNRRADEQPEE
ncbi:MAG: hypothetical protein ACOCZB_08905 [Spirochaetota bacterium]